MGPEAINKVNATTASTSVREMPGYELILTKAKEYARIFTAVESDVVFQQFFKTKDDFKRFCIDAYRTGKTPIDLHRELFGDRTDFSEKSAASRAYKKIDSYYASRSDHEADAVVYTADKVTTEQLNQLYGKLSGMYDLIADSETVYKIDGEISHADLREAKKGDSGIVKTLKKNKQFLANELKDELAKALAADGVTNQKTFNKINNTREKVHAKEKAG